MTTLRVLLPGPPEPARADAWVLIDAQGRRVRHGCDVPAKWPAADRREAVVAAESVRMLTLTLPPLPRARLVSAATYALEDRLATPAGEAAIAIGERRPDGRVTAIVVAKDLADALVDAQPAFARAIAEPELPRPSEDWRWCEGAGGGFVRAADGSAFPVSRTADEALPPELSLGLAQAKRSGTAPAQVIVDRPAGAQQLAQWTREHGVAFRGGTPWRWDADDPAAYGAATDLIAGLRRARPSPASRSPARFATALAIAATALALHLAAAAGSWAWERYALARADRALVPLAQQAGATGATAATAFDTIGRAHTDARHRAGLSAPGDALPVLARAAPALAALPAGSLKTATWSGGAWTLELASVDDKTMTAFAGRLTAAGLVMLQAKSASGVRARVSPMS